MKNDDEEGIMILVQRGSGRCELPEHDYLSTSELKTMSLPGKPDTADQRRPEGNLGGIAGALVPYRMKGFFYRYSPG
jgi:hypothetical protein